MKKENMDLYIYDLAFVPIATMMILYLIGWGASWNDRTYQIILAGICFGILSRIHTFLRQKYIWGE